MLETLQQWDETAFHFLNSTIANPVFDFVMPWITDLHHSWSGIVFLIGILVLLIFKVGSTALRALLLSAFAMGLSDFLSHYVVKEFFQRVRPISLPGTVLRTFTHVGYSFPSNHAANNMAIAVMLALFAPRLWPYFLSWALIIGFSRIYVGVHYPGDVVGGFALGAMCSLLIYQIWYVLRQAYFRKTGDSSHEQS